MSKQDTDTLARWLERQPENATALRVSTRSLASMETVIEHVAEDLNSDGRHSLAQAIVEDTNNWADTEKKECHFLIQWLAGERVLATKKRIVSPLSDDGGMQIDGSFESLIASMQVASIEKDKMLINMTKAMVEIIVRVSEAFQGRMDQLTVQETENLKLREALIESNVADDEWKKEVFGLLKSLLPNVVVKAPPTS